MSSGEDRWHPLEPGFFVRGTEEVAADLLGRYLVRELGGGRRVVRIVETEAYLGAPDRASHAWDGRRTKRNASLYLPPGRAYVYFIYGLHHCFNVVAGRDANGAAVLFRAGEPLEGEPAMLRARGLDTARAAPAVRPGSVAGGPARLCQALDIDRELDGVLLRPPGLYLTRGDPVPLADVATGPRIGIDYAGEAAAWPLRFSLCGNPHVSRPRL